jgi:hypothetical protein
VLKWVTLQRDGDWNDLENAVLTLCTAKTQYRNSKQIFPEKELCGLSPNFHIHVSESDLYITTIGLPNLLQENMWTDSGNK